MSLTETRRGSRIVLPGDINGRFINNEVAGVKALKVEEGYLHGKRIGLRSTCMKELVIEGKCLIKQGTSECIGSGEGSPSVTISLWDVPRWNELSEKL